MAAEVIDKGKDKASRKVRKFLVKQLQQVTKELGGLAAQDWEVPQCAAIMKNITASVQNKEMKAELEGSFDAWVGFLYEQATDHHFPVDGSDEPSPKRLCREISSSARPESGEIEPCQKIGLPSTGQLQSCCSLDEFCEAVTGFSLKGLHESVAKVHPSKGIEMGRKLLRATGGTLSVLSGRNQLGLFFPVLSCLQTVSHNIETGGSKEILCSLQRTLNDLISTVIAWLPMNKLGSHISRHFDDSSAPCDGRLVAMLIALDLELLWITLAPKDDARRVDSSYTIVYRRRARERCKHCVEALGNSKYLTDLFDFLGSGDYQADFTRMGVVSGDIWMALFEGAWSLSELPSHKKALYVHRIALARLTKEMHPILYSKMYSTDEIGFQAHPVQQASQEPAHAGFGMWASTQSGHPLLMEAWKKGPMCVTKLLMKELTSSAVIVIAKSWAQRVAVPGDTLQEDIAGHTPDEQQLFFTDTAGTLGAWEGGNVAGDGSNIEDDADESDLESIDLSMLESLPEAEGKAQTACQDDSDGLDIM